MAEHIEGIGEVPYRPGTLLVVRGGLAIASAIYWSWWRARDMHGEAP